MPRFLSIHHLLCSYSSWAALLPVSTLFTEVNQYFRCAFHKDFFRKRWNGKQLQPYSSYRDFTSQQFNLYLYDRTIAKLASYLQLGYPGLFHPDDLSELFATQLTPLLVNVIVVIHSIICTNLAKVFTLTAQLIEGIHLLVVYLSFGVNFVINWLWSKDMLGCVCIKTENKMVTSSN